MEYFFHKDKTIKLGILADYMWDRCQTINKTNNIKLITPIGNLNNIDFFSECIKRSKQLSELNLPICLFWSGGLDSTAVFLLLREFLPKDKLKILYTNKSLYEYPDFFEKNIKDIYQSYCFEMNSMGEIIDLFSKQNILVTGEIGDQIFGSSWLTAISKDEINENWREYNNSKLTLIPNIKQFIDSCPRKIESIGEILWWFNYAMKYQYVQVRMLLDNNAILNKNIYHFFDTQEFNDYAVSTPLNIKMPDFDVSKYKYPLRQVIYNLSKDEVFAFKKPKVQSWSPSNKQNKAIAIDTNWTRYYENN